LFSESLSPLGDGRSVELGVRHVDELIAQLVITGLRGTHRPSRSLTHPI